MSAPSGGAAPPLWRRLLPWLVAVLFLALALWRVDPGEVARHLGRVSLPAYAAFVGACLAVNLSLDSLASWRVYRLVAPTLRFRDLLVVRGASYLPGTINFHVGQAYLTFLLSRRHGAPVVSVAGATLLSYATFFGGVVALHRQRGVQVALRQAGTMDRFRLPTHVVSSATTMRQRIVVPLTASWGSVQLQPYAKT